MKRKSILARLGVMAVAVTLATTTLVSGTLARYEAGAGGKATAMVAKWGAEFKLGSTALENGVTEGVTIQLAGKKFDEGDAKVGVSGASQVYDGENVITMDQTDDSTLLVPGMNGYFDIEIDMVGSEVDTDYQIGLAKEDGSAEIPANMVFYYELVSETGTAISSTKKNVNKEDLVIYDEDEPSSVMTVAKGLIYSAAVAENKSDGTIAHSTKRTVRVHWDWPYDESAYNTLVQLTPGDPDATPNPVPATYSPGYGVYSDDNGYQADAKFTDDEGEPIHPTITLKVFLTATQADLSNRTGMNEDSLTYNVE